MLPYEKLKIYIHIHGLLHYIIILLSFLIFCSIAENFNIILFYLVWYHDIETSRERIRFDWIMAALDSCFLQCFLSDTLQLAQSELSWKR